MKAGIIGVKYTDKPYLIYKEIKKILESQGVKVDYSYFESSAEEDYADMEKTYNRNQKLLKNNDFIVAETTHYGSGIGYLIANALNEKKPVLALYNVNEGTKPSAILKEASAKSKLLTFYEYSAKDLQPTIKNFLKELKSIMDTKFILIISPKIERYLEWAADHKRMHKAQVVRQAIEDMMEKDKDFKAHLKG